MFTWFPKRGSLFLLIVGVDALEARFEALFQDIKVLLLILIRLVFFLECADKGLLDIVAQGLVGGLVRALQTLICNRNRVMLR